RFESGPEPAAIFWFPVALACLPISVYMAVSALTRRVVLYPDVIEERTIFPFGRKRMNRLDIAHKQTMRGIATVYLLFPRDPAGKIRNVTARDDPYFRDWMAGIPDRSMPQ